MEIDDVAVNAPGLVGDHALVGELHRVARHEPGGDPARPHQRDQQRGDVAAAAAALAERLLRRPHPGLVADHVGDALADLRVEPDQHAHRVTARRQLGQELGRLAAEAVGRIAGVEERRELGVELVGVAERQALHPLVDQEVERVDRADVDRELDQHIEHRQGLFGLEGHPGDVIAVRVALPVQPVLGCDRQLVALDHRTRVVGGSQPDQLRSEQCRLRIDVATAVLDHDAHGRFLPGAGAERDAGSRRRSRYLPRWVILKLTCALLPLAPPRPLVVSRLPATPLLTR
jgi:hypothetical protein